MALANPFQTSPVFLLSHPPSKRNSLPVLLYSLSSHPFKQLSARGKHARCGAMADVKASPSLDHKDEEDHKVLLGPSSEEELRGEQVVADYDWTEEWYPLYLTQHVPDDAPLGLKVFDKQLVLFKDGNGELHCYEDRCPHRLAKLSEGQLVDGRLECLYHGWQFEGEGKCVKIPQLPADAKIPRSACVKTYEARVSRYFHNS
ncbi:hypothetical protein K1719_022526 [Acacia pycnantha]|nr:hypothetical protein K1719_022526 [Acacia pycnantha]